MQEGDANFVTSATVGGSIGGVFTGSTTAGDVFGGSIGNDTFTLQQGGAPETIYTGGGQDTINLFAGHTASDHVEFYAGFETAVTPGGVEVPSSFDSGVVAGSITQGTDVVQLGWWGLATGATETGYGATAADYAGIIGIGGTSADMSTVSNFNAGKDVLDFAASSSTGYGPVWGSGGANGLGGTALGITDGAFAAFTGGAPAVGQQVNPGGTVAGTTTLIELTTGTFANANAVAQALDSATYAITFGAPLGANDSAHMLVAYQDLSGSTRIADLAIANPTAGPLSSSLVLDEHASDIVQVTGVPLLSAAPDVHFA